MGSVETQVAEVVFRFLEGENEGVEIRVNPPRELTIGRSEECDIFLGEKKISRKHCRFVVAKEGVKLVDLQSTNGTFLNSKKVTGEIDLENNDKVRVGTSVIQVAVDLQKAVLQEEGPTRTVVDEPQVKPEFAESLEDAGEDLLEEADDSPSGTMDVPPEESFSLGFGEAPEVKPVAPKKAPEPEKKGKPLSGNLSAMGLADLLQNLSQNRKSGMLTLNAAMEGKVAMVDGRVVSANAGGASGSKAVYRMLGWNDGEFELLPLPGDFDSARVENPIKESLENLLMEGFRQFDELEKIRKALPALNATLKVKHKLTAPLSKLHPRVLDILQTVLNEGRFSSVLDASPLSDLETSKVVFYLLKKDYVVAE